MYHGERLTMAIEIKLEMQMCRQHKQRSDLEPAQAVLESHSTCAELVLAPSLNGIE